MVEENSRGSPPSCTRKDSAHSYDSSKKARRSLHKGADNFSGMEYASFSCLRTVFFENKAWSSDSLQQGLLSLYVFFLHQKFRQRLATHENT
mmetsp:Transcript_13856/g.26903  ORF Transcript_13856/g.26903 Transcript_13856/m.26903 type:complete len:92 (+) Transcript_13856:438-713(+)